MDRTLNEIILKILLVLIPGIVFVIYELLWNSILQTSVRYNDGIIMIFLNLILPMVLIMFSTLICIKLWPRKKINQV